MNFWTEVDIEICNLYRDTRRVNITGYLIGNHFFGIVWTVVAPKRPGQTGEKPTGTVVGPPLSFRVLLVTRHL